MERNHDGSAGRTSRAPSPQTKAGTSRQSSKRLSVLKSRPPKCLRLVKKAGPGQTTMWVSDGALHTEYLMHNGGVSPNAEQESSLSQILQVNVPKRYYLSPKACQGILRRASERGKELPETLRKALERQAQMESDSP